MPILWRYLLKQYLRVFLLSTVAFIAILLTTRLEEIAHFASLGATWATIAWFTLYQIPYILPVVIPISCLISSILLVKGLSNSQELTAMRASGFSLRDIFSPVLCAALLIAFLNFYIISELSTSSHLASGTLKSQLRAVNPLLLLQNKHLMRLKGYYFDIQGSSKVGEYASDVILALPNRNKHRMTLLLAKNLESTPTAFIGNQITMISSKESLTEEQFDPLLIENIATIKSNSFDFAQMIETKTFSIQNDHLKITQLLDKLSRHHQDKANAIEQNQTTGEQKKIQREINRSYAEIVRRSSLSLSAFTFTLMGMAFGINISRRRSIKGIFAVVGLAAFFLVTYFAAKGIDHLLEASLSLYLFPHGLILAGSFWMLRRANRGVGS